MPGSWGAPPARSGAGVLVAVLVVGGLLVVAGLVGAVALSRTSSAAAPASSPGLPTATGSPPPVQQARPAGTEPPRPIYRLGDHPLFADEDHRLSTAGCTLPRWRTDPQSARRYFARAIACLDATWKPLLESLNLPHSTPRLSVPRRAANAETPCTNGSSSFSAFYCAANRTVYLPLDSLQIDEFGDRHGVYLAVLAHEYGHHVEYLAGISDEYWERRYDAGFDSGRGLQLSRRHELQAQCFSGLFFGAGAAAGGSISDTVFRDASTSQNRGDEENSPDYRDHGASRNYVKWWRTGAAENRTARCNTWSATASEVY